MRILQVLRAVGGGTGGASSRSVAWGRFGAMVRIIVVVGILPGATVGAEGPSVEIQIHNTGEAGADYLTWSPTPARIRLVTLGPAGTDTIVVLTNHPPSGLPEGCEPGKNGGLLFATAAHPGKTADQDTLALTLPPTGEWRDFVIAGKFGQASTCDKDAVIAVHEGEAGGSVIHTHAVMVRVRKDARKLTARERRRFLEALADLHVNEAEYVRFVRTHEVAGKGKFNQGNQFWPDVGHLSSAFLAWHRAYLLTLERRLQQKYPDVALPYWVVPEESTVFDVNFMGANRVSGEIVVPAEFSPENPLYQWSISGVPLMRSGKDRTSALELASFTPQENSLNFSGDYRAFGRRIEGNPHGVGHVWTGPWMRNCLVSPSDPIFWVFHAFFDRMWAKWQYRYGRFLTDGSRKEDYSPADAFDPNAPGCDQPQSPSCAPIGHHLKDTMWPWNEAVGPGPKAQGNRPSATESAGLLGKFPASGVPGIWPATAAAPTPGDMIDYFAITGSRLPMGFAYDDIPYGSELPVPQTPVPGFSLATFLDAGMPGPSRLDAARVATATPAEVGALRVMVGNASESDDIRIAALRHLGDGDSNALVDGALLVLKDTRATSTRLAQAALEALVSQMMFTEAGIARQAEIMHALEGALTDPRRPVRAAAMQGVLAGPHRSAKASQILVAGLQQPAKALFLPAEAINALSLSGIGPFVGVVRPYLNSRDPEVRAAAVRALMSDPNSASRIVAMLADPRESVEVRSAALVGVRQQLPRAAEVASSIVQDSGANIDLRARAAGALANLLLGASPKVRDADRTRARGALEGLGSLELRRIGPAADRALEAVRSLEKK